VRLSIVQGAARGLAYLHECSPRRYVHGCIKSSKILLDDELRAHVSGFGLARLVAGAHKSAAGHSKKLGSAACALRGGAVSYVAPELRAPGGAPAAAATQKGDVFAFGVVLLEAVTGREPTEGEGGMDLEAWVRRAFKEERPLSEVVDPPPPRHSSPRPRHRPRGASCSRQPCPATETTPRASPRPIQLSGGRLPLSWRLAPSRSWTWRSYPCSGSQCRRRSARQRPRHRRLPATLLGAPQVQEALLDMLEEYNNARKEKVQERNQGRSQD